MFVKNENTPLSLKAAKAWFTGENVFNANFALKGGAISADQNSLITVFMARRAIPMIAFPRVRYMFIYI